MATWLRECFAGKGAPITQSAVKLAALTREEQKHFLLNALRFVRELGVACAGTPQPLRLAPSDAQVSNKLAALVTWPQLTALADELNRLRRELTRIVAELGGRFRVSVIRAEDHWPLWPWVTVGA